jgi:hypothetical protein
MHECVSLRINLNNMHWFFGIRVALGVKRDKITAIKADKRLRAILEGADPTEQGKTLDDKVKLFDAFLKSGGFYILYNRSIYDVSRTMSDEDATGFYKLFVSRLFEDLAYLFMQHRGIGPVLSQKDTLDFFRWLYPGAQFRPRTLGFDTLAGITVPDGILLEEQAGIYRPIMVGEYTLAAREEYFQHKFKAFKKRKTDFEMIFGNSQLLFVVPEGIEPSKFIDNPDISTEYVPFNRKEINDFAYELFNDTIPEKGLPTVAEHFQRYKGKQVKTVNVNGRTDTTNADIFFSRPRLVYDSPENQSRK